MLFRSNQTICNGDIPGQISSTAPGNSGSASIEYEWQISIDGGNTWQNLTGNSENYTFTGPVTQTSIVRRRTVAILPGGNYCYSNYTQSVTISVIPPPTAGVIGGTQTICHNNIPSTITSIQNGTSPGSQISYRWEYSIDDGATWTEIIGAIVGSYTPSNQHTTTTWYRRITLATRDGKTCSSQPTSTTIVTVQQEVNSGSIKEDQTICYDNIPATITSLVDGSGSAAPVYSWQYSIDNGTSWLTISGATNATYSPGKLIQTTWYRRIVNITVNGRICTATTAPVIIEVLDDIIPPVVAASQGICYNTIPTALSFTSTGNFNYQWQSSTDNINFSDIPGQTGTTYQPGVLTNTRYYRIKTSLANCDPEYSNTVEITVWPQVSAPTICCSLFRCIFNDAPPLTITNPVDGFGPNVTYQWQRSRWYFALWPWPPGYRWSVWEPIPGATSPTYTPTDLVSRYQYRLRIID